MESKKADEHTDLQELLKQVNTPSQQESTGNGYELIDNSGQSIKANE